MCLNENGSSSKEQKQQQQQQQQSEQQSRKTESLEDGGGGGDGGGGASGDSSTSLTTSSSLSDASIEEAKADSVTNSQKTSTQTPKSKVDALRSTPPSSSSTPQSKTFAKSSTFQFSSTKSTSPLKTSSTSTQSTSSTYSISQKAKGDRIDGSASSSTSLSTSSSSSSTSIKTRSVRKRSTSSLVANMISDLNTKAETPLTLVGGTLPVRPPSLRRGSSSSASSVSSAVSSANSTPPYSSTSNSASSSAPNSANSTPSLSKRLPVAPRKVRNIPIKSEKEQEIEIKREEKREIEIKKEKREIEIKREMNGRDSSDLDTPPKTPREASEASQKEGSEEGGKESEARAVVQNGDENGEDISKNKDKISEKPPKSSAFKSKNASNLDKNASISEVKSKSASIMDKNASISDKSASSMDKNPVKSLNRDKKSSEKESSPVKSLNKEKKSDEREKSPIKSLNKEKKSSEKESSPVKSRKKSVERKSSLNKESSPVMSLKKSEKREQSPVKSLNKEKKSSEKESSPLKSRKKSESPKPDSKLNESESRNNKSESAKITNESVKNSESSSETVKINESSNETVNKTSESSESVKISSESVKSLELSNETVNKSPESSSIESKESPKRIKVKKSIKKSKDSTEEESKREEKREGEEEKEIESKREEKREEKREGEEKESKREEEEEKREEKGEEESKREKKEGEESKREEKEGEESKREKAESPIAINKEKIGEMDKEEESKREEKGEEESKREEKKEGADKRREYYEKTVKSSLEENLEAVKSVGGDLEAVGGDLEAVGGDLEAVKSSEGNLEAVRGDLEAVKSVEGDLKGVESLKGDIEGDVEGERSPRGAESPLNSEELRKRLEDVDRNMDGATAISSSAEGNGEEPEELEESKASQSSPRTYKKYPLIDLDADEPELDNVSIFVIVRDMSALTATVNKVTIVTPPSSTCGELMQEVGRRFKYDPDSFSLILQCTDGSQVEIERMEAERTLADARFQTENTPRNNLILCDLDGQPPRPKPDDDDLGLGASASPTASTTAPSSASDWSRSPVTYTLPASGSSLPQASDYSYASALIKHDTGFVGLVNQAMTCYLNSLLQTLYMTPEFRNALYSWQFKGTPDEASKNIPCQLQRLFLLLQTSKKSAIETTKLTRSFGWDSSEAWQQHDIQELCRVMFDALEQCFKNTHQSDLINSLYQGKMSDYVKCLECGNEGAREDTYLDIPLPIRPFGCNAAYKSVEEALHAFVSPELLTENNQYKCSRCDKLCDAHKGLKFTSFPYLLTIHLMRFDFDYQTLHRIKLNDKVTFPDILNLNSFIDGTDDISTMMGTSTTSTSTATSHTASTPDKHTAADKVDDASTTDSGSALDVEDSSVDNTSTSQPESDNQDEDEGIDVSSVYNERNKTSCNSTGPFIYELFSIMIHSGSASGGHYYAYIKDFHTGQWFCFNDQSVTKITYDDIRKTYGGGSRGGYYSSWSSSANAYMLMYRQVVKERNVYSLTNDELPKHIKDLVERMEEEEAVEREQRELERSTCRIKLFCQVPGSQTMLERKLRVHKDATLKETTQLAHKELGIDSSIPLERCRLVKYEEFHDSLECSFEGQDNEPIWEVLGGVRSSYKFDLLLEIREEGRQFEVYKPGGTTIKAHIVNLETEEVEGPYSVRGALSMTIRELKEQLARSLDLNADLMRVVLERYYNDLRPLTSDTKTLKMEGFYRSNKVYIEASGVEATDFFTGSQMLSILDRFENTITLYCPLPDTSKEALEELQIPPYKEEDEVGEGSSSKSKNSLSTATNGTSTTTATSPADSAASPASCSSKDSGISSKGTSETPGSEESEANQTPQILSSLASPSDSSSSSSSPISSATDGATEPTTTATDSLHTATSTNTLVSPLPSSSGVGSDGEEEAGGEDSGTGSSHVNSDQSASEDSSLTSDSDRTLVGDPPEDKLSDASNSPDYRNVSSPEDNTRDNKSEDVDSGWGLPIFQDTDVVWGDNITNDDNRETEVRRYFRAQYFTEDDTQQKMLRVHVDKRITVGQLKLEMQRWVGVSHQHFKLFKIYSNSQEFECTRTSETLTSYGDNTRLTVRLGRALLPGEHRGKVYLLDPNNTDDVSTPAKFLIDWVVSKGETITAAKKAIVKEVNSRCNMQLTTDKIQLRKKSWKNPQSVYLDHQKFDDDISLYTNWELFLQQVNEGEEVKTREDELSLFVRRWRPSKHTTDTLREIVISEHTVEALKTKLSDISGIAADDIDIAKGKSTFPCDMCVVDLSSDLDWQQRIGSLDTRPYYIMDDGAVLYYRDRTEAVKELSDEERRELIASENRRLNRDFSYSTGATASTTSNYSSLRSKEKGLKIYLNHDD